MIALVVSTKNEIRRVEYDPPHYDVIKEAVGGWYERVHPMGLIFHDFQFSCPFNFDDAKL